MTWLVSLYWQLHEAQRAFIDRFSHWAADAVGHWDHERKCIT